MFENKSEQEARKILLGLVNEYYNTYKNGQDKYHEGDRIPYAGRVFNEEEMCNLADSSLDFWLTSGKYTKEFEDTFCRMLGIKFCSLVNSGSSANLLAFMALTSHLLGERAIQRGDEVITVAAGFPTTVAPVVQYGAVPVFVDVTVPGYNIDVSKLEEAVSSRTKAVMLAHTLGNPFDIKPVKEFCDNHGLWLIEDNCDALGSKYIMDGREYFTGTLGDIGTSSFYPPHHITMGEGGAVYTNDPLLHKIIRSMRDWGRECSCEPGQDNKCGHRFDGQYGELPTGYDHKYVYSHFGYNLKVTDMQAAIGCAQIKKLAGFTEKRRKNFDILYDALKDCGEYLVLPEATKNAIPSWFGFVITCKKGIERSSIVRHLEKEGIQTRMLFAGNLVKHPCFDAMRRKGEGYRIAGSLENTDRIMENTFWTGVFPGMTEDMLMKMAKEIKASL